MHDPNQPSTQGEIPEAIREGGVPIVTQETRQRVRACLTGFSGTRRALRALLTEKLNLHENALQEDYEGTFESLGENDLPPDTIRVTCTDGEVAIAIVSQTLTLYYRSEIDTNDKKNRKDIIWTR